MSRPTCALCAMQSRRGYRCFARHAEPRRNARPRIRALESRVARVLERTPEVAKRRRKLDEAWRLLAAL